MQVIELDIPLLLVGLISLLWIRVRRPFYEFQVACQFFGTFWAQYSFVVSWSLGKLIPYISSSSVFNKRIPFGLNFFPFVFYVVFYSVISSFFWKIPVGVEFAYGEGRVWIQLSSFIFLVLTTRGFAAAMSDERAVALMWKAIVVLGLLHGGAFFYQYGATVLGLPFIGISRAHGLNFESGVGDVAAFSVDGGIEILRPGGLAGEPKTVAIVFGLILISLLTSGSPPNVLRRWALASKLSVALSAIGFVGAFSTSGYIGFVVSLVVLVFLKVIKGKIALRSLLLIAMVLAVGELVLLYLALPSLVDLIALRTFDRVGQGSEMDPPVEAAVSIMASDFSVLMLGTGVGGGSFRIMEYMGKVFEYSLSPNIGVVAFVFEFGVLGLLLFLGPFFVLAVRIAMMIRSGGRWSAKFLISLGVPAMVFMMTGSGIALGYPLAVGALLGANACLNTRSKI